MDKKYSHVQRPGRCALLKGQRIALERFRTLSIANDSALLSIGFIWIDPYMLGIV